MDKTRLQKAKTPAPKKTNKKLLTKLSDNVEVFCRIRPLDNPSELSCIRKINVGTVGLFPPENSNALRNGPVCKETQHTFQCVFDEQTTQKALFDQVGFSLIDYLLHGKNALLFAYGVTSSGKTYTMTGTPQNPGILPRSLDCIFFSLEDLLVKKYMFKPDKMNGFDVQSEADAVLERQNREITSRLVGQKTTQTGTGLGTGVAGSQQPIDQVKVDDIDTGCRYSVFISYVEIYNNYVYDLLDEEQMSNINRLPVSKAIREDPDHNMYVSGAVEVEITSPTDAFELLQKGQKRRKVANTALNSESSRSHSIFNIRVVRAALDENGEIVLDKKRLCVSQLALVDLAGSERSQRTGAAGDRIKEAGNINNSLMTLRSCIEILRENQKTGASKLVPYRDSKLTHLFKNYFDGEGKVKMIVCINSKASEYDETTQVMKFAELTQEVQIARPQTPAPTPAVTPSVGPSVYRKDSAAPWNVDDDDSVTARSPVVYSLGPPFPSLELFNAADDQTLSLLMKFLEDRFNFRNCLLVDLAQKDDCFRSRLLGIEKENRDFRQTVSVLKASLEEREYELLETKRRLTAAEKLNEASQQKITFYQQERFELEREVGEKNWKLIQEKLEKDGLRHDFNSKLALKEQQYKLELERARRRAYEETDGKLRAKQMKIDMMRRVLDANTDSGSSASSADTPSSASGSRHGPPPVSSLRSRICAVKPESEPVDAANDGSSFTRSSAQRLPLSGRTFQPRPVMSRCRSPPPPVKPKPPVAQKLHRRSRSSEAVWLDHRPEDTVDTGTLLRPCMKTSKSVAKLSDKDIRSGSATDYVLTHQDIDSDGDFATQLIKGNIVTTSSGGAAVVFTDIEVMKQKSPCDRKRRSSTIDDYTESGQKDDDWATAATVEQRFSAAFEGHASNKKSKFSAI